MVTRRTTLLAMVGAGLARASRAEAAAQQAVSAPSPQDPSKTSAGAAAQRSMQDDLARMGSHEYSDEGIPVFLACEDLGARPPLASPSELGQQVATDLRRYADAWERMHPDAPDTDVAKIIEVLAERDFALDGRRVKR